MSYIYYMYDSFSGILDFGNIFLARSLEERRLCDHILHVSNLQHLFYINHELAYAWNI